MVLSWPTSASSGRPDTVQLHAAYESNCSLQLKSLNTKIEKIVLDRSLN